MTDYSKPGTIDNPLPSTTSKIEPKTWAATTGAYLASAVALSIVNLVTGNNNQLLTDALPDAVEVFVLPLVPAVVAFVSAWAARHQYRRNNAQVAR